MKQAVAFVLDASPSMLNTYPRPSGRTKVKQEQQKTRFDCAKQSVEYMISDLMLQSITNEVCVILCKTLHTRHHKMAEGEDFDNVPFPNLTELTLPDGVMRPNVDLLRRLSQVQPTPLKNFSTSIQGDIIDGILLAADALYERTNKKKYERQIIIFTDAEHDIVMDVNQILVVIDSLRSMECKLKVIGLDFEISGSYDVPAAAPVPIKQEIGIGMNENPNKKIKVEDDDETVDPNAENCSNSNTADAEDFEEEEEEEDNNENVVKYRSKPDRERLLLSLTEKTGGEVVAATTLHEVLFANKGKKLQTTTRRKFVLIVAPGLQVDARYSLIMKKTSQETLKTEAVLVDDETGRPLIEHGTGREVTDNVESITQYVDATNNPDSAVDPDSITTAIRYGSDFIPMSSFDFDGLRSIYMTHNNDLQLDNTDDQSIHDPRMEVLGYIKRKNIPKIYLQGPPYVVSGNDSQRAASLIAALAQAFERLQKIAIVLFFKTKNSTEPILGGLFSIKLSEDGNRYPPYPMHLIFLQIPFAGDVRNLTMASFEQYFVASENGNDNDVKLMQQKLKACESLIDSLRLPDGCLETGKVPSPFLRSWNQTKVKRAIDNAADLVVNVRETTDEGKDPMATPPEILDQANNALIQFQQTFPLSMQTKPNSTKVGDSFKIKGRRSILTYKDFLDGN